MTNLETNPQTTGHLEGSIQIDTGKTEILSNLNQLESQLQNLSSELSTTSSQHSELVKRLSDELTNNIRDLKKETLNKLREQESILTTIRKTLAKLDSRQGKQAKREEEILRTTKELQDQFVFEERVLPGVQEIIKVRDDVVGQLTDMEQNNQRHIFLQALDTALLKTLKKFGVEEVNSSDDGKFDPEIQEVTTKETTLEARQDKKVVEILKPGYTWKEKLIRPQKVKIAEFKGGKNE
ncbi:nucleotide exchange factor GrpE [Candidatus Bipolaricaulota bacterium]|nr:nucleotide exchange factor GrpE [Candidatus Bipolaricaulota bacterium]